jgi:hypothetical protein
MKTSELTGAALNWAVAVCEEYILVAPDGEVLGSHVGLDYSTDWSQGGPIIEREEIDIIKVGIKQWRARIEGGNPVSRYGPTILIAAMRCNVASKLGDEVDIPKELT